VGRAPLHRALRGNLISREPFVCGNMVRGHCGCPVVHLLAVVDQTYLVALKPPNPPLQQVVAATVEVHGEHLAFLSTDGKLGAFFRLDTVQSWYVLPGP
jgi:hypothetical protein